MELDLEDPHISSDWAALFKSEDDHMSSAASLDLPARRHVVTLISQCLEKLDADVGYLAVNYADRYLSCNSITEIDRTQSASDRFQGNNPWIGRLLAATCLILASKMKDYGGFSLRDLKMAAEGGLDFEAMAIRRMELLVLQALGWRMRSITPFAFIRFFLAFFVPSRPNILHDLKARAYSILYNCQSDVRMMEFKPSVIAASALIAAAEELFPAHSPAFRSAISSSGSIKEESLLACTAAIGEAAKTNAGGDTVATDTAAAAATTGI